MTNTCDRCGEEVESEQMQRCDDCGALCCPDCIDWYVHKYDPHNGDYLCELCLLGDDDEPDGATDA